MAAASKMKASSSVVPLSTDDDSTMVVVTVDGMKNPTPPAPSPVSVDKAAKKKTTTTLLSPLFVSVKVAGVLALLSAVLLAAYAAYSLRTTPCDPAVDSSAYWCIEMSDTAAAKVLALWRGQLWVSGVEAAAALLGLLLAGRRSLALAFIAVTVGAANICMGAVVQAFSIAAAPGNHALRLDAIAYVVFFAVLDLIGFIVLCLGLQDDDQ